MCRYAFKTYKIHFACFDCRKSFKKLPFSDLMKANGDWDVYMKAFGGYNKQRNKNFRKENPEIVEMLIQKYKNREEKCPECAKLMANVGKDFKAPKKERKKQWRILQGLYESGVSFNSCGCDSIGHVPRTIRDYVAALERDKCYYQTTLNNRGAKSSKEKLSDYIERFSDRLHLIEAELDKIM